MSDRTIEECLDKMKRQQEKSSQLKFELKALDLSIEEPFYSTAHFVSSEHSITGRLAFSSSHRADRPEELTGKAVAGYTYLKRTRLSAHNKDENQLSNSLFNIEVSPYSAGNKLRLWRKREGVYGPPVLTNSVQPSVKELDRTELRESTIPEKGFYGSQLCIENSDSRTGKCLDVFNNKDNQGAVADVFGVAANAIGLGDCASSQPLADFRQGCERQPRLLTAGKTGSGNRATNRLPEQDQRDGSIIRAGHVTAKSAENLHLWTPAGTLGNEHPPVNSLTKGRLSEDFKPGQLHMSRLPSQFRWFKTPFDVYRGRFKAGVSSSGINEHPGANLRNDCSSLGRPLRGTTKPIRKKRFDDRNCIKMDGFLPPAKHKPERQLQHDRWRDIDLSKTVGGGSIRDPISTLSSTAQAGACPGCINCRRSRRPRSLGDESPSKARFWLGRLNKTSTDGDDAPTNGPIDKNRDSILRTPVGPLTPIRWDKGMYNAQHRWTSFRLIGADMLSGRTVAEPGLMDSIWLPLTEWDHCLLNKGDKLEVTLRQWHASTRPAVPMEYRNGACVGQRSKPTVGCLQDDAGDGHYVMQSGRQVRVCSVSRWTKTGPSRPVTDNDCRLSRNRGTVSPDYLHGTRRRGEWNSVNRSSAP